MDHMERTTLVVKLNFKLKWQDQVYVIIVTRYIRVKGTLTVLNTGTVAAPNNRNKKVIFKNYTPFTNCIGEMKNKEIDHAKGIDAVMPIYNLIEYSGNYSKTSGSLWQYYRDELFINNGAIIDVPDDPDNNPENINKKWQVKEEIMEQKMSS